MKCKAIGNFCKNKLNNQPIDSIVLFSTITTIESHFNFFFSICEKFLHPFEKRPNLLNFNRKNLMDSQKKKHYRALNLIIALLS